MTITKEDMVEMKLANRIFLSFINTIPKDSIRRVLKYISDLCMDYLYTGVDHQDETEV